MNTSLFGNKPAGQCSAGHWLNRTMENIITVYVLRLSVDSVFWLRHITLVLKPRTTIWHVQDPLLGLLFQNNYKKKTPALG